MQITVRVFDIVGRGVGVFANDGQRVYDRIAPLLKKEQPVVLSFEQMETMNATFFNAAIGQLYRKYSAEWIRELLSVRDMEADDQETLKRVVDSAKRYYSNPKAIDEE